MPFFQAMAIKEHIGYPDHILEENNQKLDQEYAHVRKNWVSFHSRLCSKWLKAAYAHVAVISDQAFSFFSFQLNFSEENYFENILENLKAEAHKSLKKLREPVDPDL